jgi:hypothetical protein
MFIKAHKIPNKMAIITIKGKEINAITVRDSHSRRAIQYKNNIIDVLHKIDLTEDDIDIKLENVAIKRVPASITWYIAGHRLYYSYKTANNYAENLYIVWKVIENEVISILNNEKSFEDFIYEFSEEKDVEEERKKARELLGLSPDETDIAVINKAYKELAKHNHPDKETGNTEKFKEINQAHKILRKELT